MLPPIFCILVIPTDAVFDTISFVFDTINFVSLTKPRKMSGFYVTVTVNYAVPCISHSREHREHQIKVSKFVKIL